ncbi:MAG: hypothetical protein H0X46_08890 [Bacteroidetes bacterium]|nr:hypothetical protein [Bacteroidota bacterium]
MKNYITLLFLLIGFSTFTYAQTAANGRTEKIYSHKKFKKQNTHFERPKTDKKMRYNGTRACKSMRIHQCHPEGYSITNRSTYKMNGRKWKKTKNKTFGTYTMK